MQLGTVALEMPRPQVTISQPIRDLNRCPSPRPRSEPFDCLSRIELMSRMKGREQTRNASRTGLGDGDPIDMALSLTAWPPHARTSGDPANLSAQGFPARALGRPVHALGHPVALAPPLEHQYPVPCRRARFKMILQEPSHHCGQSHGFVDGIQGRHGQPTSGLELIPTFPENLKKGTILDRQWTPEVTKAVQLSSRGGDRRPLLDQRLVNAGPRTNLILELNQPG